MQQEKILMVEAAILYYEKKLTQQEIAKRMGLTRQTVSKLLSEAVDEKVVEITIHNPQAECKAMENEIRKEFGIANALVCSVSNNDESLRKMMAVRAAAEYLVPIFLQGGQKIALSWGRTIQDLISQMPNIRTTGNVVFPLFGATDHECSYFSSNELARSMADRLGAAVKYAWFPYLTDSNEDCELIKTLSYYKKMQHVGYLRHLLLRRGDITGEILVNLVTTTQEEYDLSALVEALMSLDLEGKIVGILHILNDSLSDVVQSDETRILYGQDFFYEKLLGLEFKVTPFSFFQPNSRAAEVLYSTVREYIGDIDNMTLYDLFSGTGTIGQILAPVAKEVIGVEIIEEAVVAANENAKHNGLSNCKFIAGDVFKVLDEIEEKPDVIVLDPPRDGIHPKALPKILDYGVDKIVYISCKVTTYFLCFSMP